MHVGHAVRRFARQRPDDAAVVWCDSLTSWSELDRRTDALATGLLTWCSPGDRVAVGMVNRPELLESMIACFKAGLCVVPLNARFTLAEVRYHVQDSECAALVTDSGGHGVLAAESGLLVLSVGAEPDAPAGQDTQDPSQLVGYEALVAAGLDAGPVDHATARDDLAWLFYTSGTTGKPKGAMLTHGNLAYMVAAWLADLTNLTEDDVTVHAAPLSHGAGFHALASMSAGATQVIAPPEAFRPEAFVDLLRTSGGTNTWLVPTQVVMVADAFDHRSLDVPGLRYVVYGGAPFPAGHLPRALQTFGPVLVQLYGQGEVPMTITRLSERDHARMLEDADPRLGSVGSPRVGMQVRVVDDDGVEVEDGEIGEVVVRGPAVMAGYWKRPDATADTLRGGWLHTGDLGTMHQTGYLFLKDRSKDLIITGGSNVYPLETELAIDQHPDVVESAVFGCIDHTWGEIVAAAVVLRDGARTSADEIVAHCRKSLAAYKCPRHVFFVTELERNAYGKVSKVDLRARFVPEDPA